MVGNRRRSWLSWSLALALCLGGSAAAQARGGGGSHNSGSRSQAPSASVKTSGSTSSWRTHHSSYYDRAGRRKKPKSPRSVTPACRNGLVELRPDLVTVRARCEMDAAPVLLP